MGVLPIASAHLDGFKNDFSLLLAATLSVIAMFDSYTLRISQIQRFFPSKTSKKSNTACNKFN